MNPPNFNRRQFLAASVAAGAIALSRGARGAGSNWQQDCCNLLNFARADADRRELAIYGTLQNGPRFPLTLHPKLTAATQLWCDALQGTGILAHIWWTNAAGYLIASNIDPTVLNRRVKLPTQPVAGGYQTYWHLHVLAQGLTPLLDSQNGFVGKDVSALSCASAWINSGYNSDPRLASSHYSNVIRAAWTHCGIASAPWTAGRRSAFCDFAELLET